MALPCDEPDRNMDQELPEIWVSSSGLPPLILGVSSLSMSKKVIKEEIYPYKLTTEDILEFSKGPTTSEVGRDSSARPGFELKYK